jgi:hypothetical protein
VINQEPLKIFEVCEEFQFILCGSPLICVEDWKENTVYREHFNANHSLIQWFWNSLERLT